MEKVKIINILIGVLFLVVFPSISAGCNIYDDFSADTLDMNKWGIRQDTEGQPLMDEYWVDSDLENFHMQQNSIADRRTYLVPTHQFKVGDKISYDVDLISKEGHYGQMVLLTGDQYIRIGIFGYNYGVQGYDEIGTSHIEISFEEDALVLNRESPSGETFHDELPLFHPEGTYELYIGAFSGHNGKTHMDFDNFTICTEKLSCVIPTDGMEITEDTTFCKGEYELPNGISIGADNIVLDCNGAVLNGNGSGRGISLFSKNDVTIKNCNIQNYHTAINIHDSDSNTLSQNKIFNNVCSGIVFAGASRYNNISNNEIYQNSFWCSGDVAGIRFTFYSSYNIISYNNISNNWCSGIWLDSSSNNIISNNNISNNSEGIWLSISSNNTISSNNISNNKQGGIGLWRSSDNSIFNNIASNNNLYGIWLDSSSNNIISSNSISNNQEGVRLFSSINNLIEYNSIYNNSWINFGNFQSYNVTLEYNWWGTINKSEIKNKIYDYYDDSTRGKVDFIPFLCEPYPTDFISNEEGECVFDEDNDGIPNNEDKCPNTEGEQLVYGCSCKQILELKPGKDKSSKCSPGIIKVFTKGIGWAKDLFI